jgi:hypothetical protein
VKNGVVLPRDMEVGQAKNMRAVQGNEPGSIVLRRGGCPLAGPIPVPLSDKHKPTRPTRGRPQSC